MNRHSGLDPESPVVGEIAGRARNDVDWSIYV